MVKMPKDQMEYMTHKMFHKRNFLFKTFLINLIMVVIGFILSGSEVFIALAGHYMHYSAEQMHAYTLDLVGVWFFANLLVFFAPAVAAWWELNSMKSYHE